MAGSPIIKRKKLMSLTNKDRFIGLRLRGFYQEILPDFYEKYASKSPTFDKIYRYYLTLFPFTESFHLRYAFLKELFHDLPLEDVLVSCDAIYIKEWSVDSFFRYFVEVILRLELVGAENLYVDIIYFGNLESITDKDIINTGNPEYRFSMWGKDNGIYHRSPLLLSVVSIYAKQISSKTRLSFHTTKVLAVHRTVSVQILERYKTKMHKVCITAINIRALTVTPSTLRTTIWRSPRSYRRKKNRKKHKSAYVLLTTCF